MPPRRKQQPREVVEEIPQVADEESEIEETDDDVLEDEDNEDEDEDDDEDDEEEEEVIEPRVLPARSNRGNRMAELMAKSTQEDDTSEFWQNNKEVFAEDEVDSDFEAAGT
jgi:hypothetical protein